MHLNLNNMKIAKIINDQIFIDEHTQMFPTVAFPPDGTVPQPFMEFHNLYEVVDNVSYNSKTQKLKSIFPILIDNKVYVVEVVNKSQDECNIELLIDVRLKRDKLLKESDIYVLSDRWDSYSDEKKLRWKEYRQKLRDVPQEFVEHLDNVFWPSMPII